MAVPWWRQCRRLSSSCPSAALLENVRRFDSRPLSATASCLGRPSWCSSSRVEAVSAAASIGTQSPVAIQEGHSYSRAVSRTLLVSELDDLADWPGYVAGDRKWNKRKTSVWVTAYWCCPTLDDMRLERIVGLSIGSGSARIKVKTFANCHRNSRLCHGTVTALHLLLNRNMVILIKSQFILKCINFSPLYMATAWI